MKYGYSFSDVNESELGLMRPGIIHALDRYPGNELRARDLDSNASNKRIGRVLIALHHSGLTNGKKERSNYTVYEINASLNPGNGQESLELALGEAYDRFDTRIDTCLSRRGRDEERVVEDILTKGIHTDTHRGTERLTILRNYSDSTVNFLEDIDFVESLDEPKLLADDEDIECLRENIHVFL